MATGKYQYTPLTGPRQIRLLKLNSAASLEDPELSVDLITVSLDAAPPFEALSYTWGDPLPQAEIRCSGFSAHIGLSLYGALRRLRYPGPGPGPLLWADALCINQEDFVERTAQVRIMGDIFAAAENTVIWLGEEDGDVAPAMDLLHRFWHVWEKLGIPEDWAYDFQSMVFRFSDKGNQKTNGALQSAFGEISSQLEAFRDIWVLLRRPWFSRKWVIQEVMNSLDHGLVLLAGSNMVPWSAVQAWFAFLSWNPAASDRFILSYSPRLETSPSSISNAWSEYNRAWTLAFMGKGNRQLMHLLSNTLPFRCTDPRDHVIALLAISTDFSLHKDLVDYGVSTEELYRRLARECVQNSPDLGILWSFLSVVPVDQRTINSWTPNIEELPAMNNLALITTWMALLGKKYGGASGSTQLDAFVSGGELQIRGRIVDRVERLGMDMSAFPEVHCHPAGDFGKLYGRIVHWLDECEAIAESANLKNGTFHATILTEDLFEDWLADDVAAAKKDLPLYRQVREAIASTGDETSFHEAAPTGLGVTSLTRIDRILGRMIYRRFGRTMHGRIGWAPHVAEGGDLICLFDGMRFPYVLRPKDGSGGAYALVGDCYFSGLMAGEAMGTPDVRSEIISLK